ncbi:MAG: cobalamin biosynthesis protein CbiX [Variovorax sp.]|jgi:sirohydrochlorin cobaltochelatase|nr:MAG: cobalamin biosynthesis protein CbiX [Variovorax sp.]
MKAVILFAHGSRDPRWRDPMEAVVQRMRVQEPQTAAVCAFLELAEPDLATAATRLVAEGASSLHVVPMFLGMGKHAREDLPELVTLLRAAHPTVPVSVARAVGEEAEVTELLAKIALRT